MDFEATRRQGKLMKVLANPIRTKTLLSECLQSQAAGVNHQSEQHFIHVQTSLPDKYDGKRKSYGWPHTTLERIPL